MNIKRLSFSIREFGKLIQCAHVPVINPVLNNVEGSDVINPVVNDVEGSDDEAEKYKPLEKWQKLAKTRGGILRVPSVVRSAPPLTEAKYHLSPVSILYTGSAQVIAIITCKQIYIIFELN